MCVPVYTVCLLACVVGISREGREGSGDRGRKRGNWGRGRGTCSLLFLSFPLPSPLRPTTEVTCTCLLTQGFHIREHGPSCPAFSKYILDQGGCLLQPLSVSLHRGYLSTCLTNKTDLNPPFIAHSHDL